MRMWGSGTSILAGRPFAGVTPSRLLVGRRAGLVAPVDLRILTGGPRFDRRIGDLQPMAHLLGVLILGMTARTLAV